VHVVANMSLGNRNENLYRKIVWVLSIKDVRSQGGLSSADIFRIRGEGREAEVEATEADIFCGSGSATAKKLPLPLH